MSENNIGLASRRLRRDQCTRLAGLFATWLFGVACLSAQGVKLPAPLPEELVKANQALEEIYSDRIAKAKTPSQKKLLCEALIDEATESQDAANRYGLLNAAIRISIDAGDVDTGMKAENQVAERYQVDTIQRQIYLILKAYQNATNSVQHRAIVHHAARNRQVIPRSGDNIFPRKSRLPDVGNLISVSSVSHAADAIHPIQQSLGRQRHA